MPEFKNYKEVLLEWEGSAPLFDDVAPSMSPSGNDDPLKARVLLSRRNTDLQEMITRFSTSLAFTIGFEPSANIYTKGIFAFCIVALLNPYKVKVLSGDGLDSLIDIAVLDEETAELKVNMDDFLKHCNQADIPSTIIDWLSSNGFVHIVGNSVAFRNNFKFGKIISRA